MILGQWKHQAIIRKYVDRLGGHVELGTELVGLEQDEKSVLVTLAKTVDGQTKKETATYDYVVGADGAAAEMIS